MMLSVIIPVFRNSASLPALVEELEQLDRRLNQRLEVVFVVDGCPEKSYDVLRKHLPDAAFASRLVLLSRNFGAFSAVRAGIEAATGSHFAVMAADGQDPPELMLDFWRHLESGECDVVLGKRVARADPLTTRISSAIFWSLYRRFVQQEAPRNGIDCFAFNSTVRDHLLALEEHNSTLVGLLLWLGFRRHEVAYERRPRRHGKSAWLSLIHI